MNPISNVLSFIREGKDSWFIDLPEYIEQGGSKGALAMVAGADDLLSELDSGSGKISIELFKLNKDDEIPDESILLKRQLTIPILNAVTGATYDIRSKLSTKKIKTKMLWLCPVTLYVFNGIYPKRIAFKVIN